MQLFFGLCASFRVWRDGGHLTSSIHSHGACRRVFDGCLHIPTFVFGNDPAGWRLSSSSRLPPNCLEILSVCLRVGGRSVFLAPFDGFVHVSVLVITQCSSCFLVDPFASRNSRFAISAFPYVFLQESLSAALRLTLSAAD